MDKMDIDEKNGSWNFGGMDEMDLVRKNWILEDWDTDKIDPVVTFESTDKMDLGTDKCK